ncbi:hypothetical protein M0811_04592 [Anaeramoeba ignava]|uniref:Uncharacterized protein n=1 Tax=Anaeramoeba ignava TaxID=1746090 RepID=A0A9Q0RHL4_ANAIG|nr:hypothetical protein M0811_04592 [Anaeramoeba ignava]
MSYPFSPFGGNFNPPNRFGQQRIPEQQVFLEIQKLINLLKVSTNNEQSQLKTLIELAGKMIEYEVLLYMNQFNINEIQLNTSGAQNFIIIIII